MKTTKTETAAVTPEIIAPQQSAEARGAAMSATSKAVSIETAQASRDWERQLDLIKRTVAPNLTDDEFALFTHVAKVRNLDPLQRQIHAVKRRTWNGDKSAYEERMTLQVGIDGFRSIANRTGLYMPSPKEAKIEGVGTAHLSVTFYVLKWSPLDKQYHEYSAIAHYREFVQTYKKNDEIKPNSMWEKMPFNQLEKCAEAKALRRGWPEELGQIYVDEELQHLDSHQPTQPTVEKANDKTKATGELLTKSAEPNRGHGNEGGTQGVSTSQAAAKKTTKKSETKAAEEKPKKETKPVETYLLTCYFTDVEEKTIGTGEKQRDFQVVKCKGPKGERFTVFNWHKSYFEKVRDGVAANKKGDQVALEVHDAKSASKPDETFTQLDLIHMIGDKKVKRLDDGTVIYENPDAEIDAVAGMIPDDGF